MTGKALARHPEAGNIGQLSDVIRQQKVKDLVLFAGASLAPTFMNRDLIDEYRLMVHPIVLGEGVPCSKTSGRNGT